MKTIILIFIILILFISFASAFEIVGYTFYPDKKSNTNWIDIKRVYNRHDNSFEVIFEDLSPIKRVYYNKLLDIYYIFKEKSQWVLYNGSDIERSYLILVEPNLEREKKETWELVYSIK